MKTKLLLTLLLLAGISIPALAQLDAKSIEELNRRKQKAKEDNTVLWMYDTLYKKGEPYCLLESRVQSENGNEYMVTALDSEDIIYIKEPGNIEKLLSKIAVEANVEFSFLNEKQKLDVPKKSVGELATFIVKNDLVENNRGNMKAVKKLLFIHSNENPQGYTSNVEVENTDSAATETGTTKTTQEVKDTAAYQPVARNKKNSIVIKNHIIKQGAAIIGRYDKGTISDGLSDPITRFTIKSPDWKEIIWVTNRGFGSTYWDIEILTTGKKDTFTSTTPFHKKAFQQIVWYLVNKNLL